MEPGALALMAYALDELYHTRAANRLLELAEYELLGGVDGAIGKRAEAIFSALEQNVQAALPTVFRELVELDERAFHLCARPLIVALLCVQGAIALTCLAVVFL